MLARILGRKLRPMTIAAGLCLGSLSGNLHAENTAGAMLHVNPAKFNHKNLTALTWQAEIYEYDHDSNAPSGFRLRIEFNSVGFMGSNGTRFHNVGVMLQNVGHEFVNDSGAAPGSTVTTFPALGLYLTSLNSTWPDSLHGVDLLVDPEAWPRFGRVFQNIDYTGFVGKNVYTREDIGSPSPSDPIHVRWTVTKMETVTDPPQDLSKDISGNWVPLIGTFVIWRFEIEINGTSYAVADYYLPIEYAEFIWGWDPLKLHQEYFGAKEQILDQQKGTVRYSDMRAFDGEVWHPLNDWMITWRIDDGGGNIEDRFGWKSDGSSLFSTVGHEEDSTQSYRDPGTVFTLDQGEEHDVIDYLLPVIGSLAQ